MSAPAPRRRLFWYVYLHGLAMLVVVAFATGGLVRIVSKVLPFSSYAEDFARNLGAQRSWEHPDTMEAELKRELALTGAQMTVRGWEGEVIASNVKPPLAPLRPEQLVRLHHGPVPTPAFFDGKPRFRYYLSVPLPDKAEPTAYITIAVPLALPIAERLTVMLLGVLGVMALISIPLARLITRPMERLTSTARSLGQGDLSVRSGIRRNDEVGELAGAFDEMAERLQRLIRGEKDLLANVSHELRTPLARIGVALDLAQEAEPTRLPGYLQEMRADVTELNRLVNDVLTAARLDTAVGESGLPPLHREPIGAGELVDRSARHFRELHPARALEVSLAEPLPVIEVDPVLWGRALDNVLDNARKYSDAAAPIQVRASANDAALTVEVVDQGIGIEPADLPRLFTPFFRTDTSRARGTGGVGLGLALTRRIVEAHGGTVAVESRPSKGSCVRFVLPLVRPGV